MMVLMMMIMMMIMIAALIRGGPLPTECHMLGTHPLAWFSSVSGFFCVLYMSFRLKGHLWSLLDRFSISFFVVR